VFTALVEKGYLLSGCPNYRSPLSDPTERCFTELVKFKVRIEKQDAAGVVVDRKVEATLSVDVLAKVTISLGVIP
jgi:hypothetical protein